MKIVQSIVDGAFRLAIARSRRGGASVRVQPSLFYVQDRRIEINQIESTRSNQTNHTQSNAIQRNPIRSNPPLDRADLRRREIRPIDRTIFILTRSLARESIFFD